MKKFIIEKDFLEIFPNAKIGVLVCKGINNHIEDEEKYAEQSEAFDSGGATSQSIVCLQRFFWQQALQSNQCVSDELWIAAY